ncbi:phage protein Gp36 family protein [Horticoccus sp. 23ND18S-11]|uniref:phage protein Gp36 family protein n=1 Tax=Horticoccus sp. 23ND18S-11 TaxID=3391832 RepID=UPI0039C94918
MPAYIIMATLVAEVPPQFITQALDDDGDGAADPGLFDQIVSNAQTEIDGILGQRFTVPFQNPIPAIVVDAATKFVAEKLYSRRGVDGDKNPWTKKATEIRALLKAIAKGDAPLTPTTARERPSASAITEPARTTSARGRAAI